MMIIPLGDDNSDLRRPAIVNYILIAINILVFVFFQGLGGNTNFTYAFSTVPEEIVTGEDLVTEDQVVNIPNYGRVTIPGLRPTPISVYITLLTSMFMHGSLLHIGGNMLYLWIFGDNLEDRMGHGRYLSFYLLCGLLASLSHVALTVFMGQDTQVPSLGASGAIAGALGGYMLLFPQRRVRVIFLRMLTNVPAVVAVGFWFVLQIFGGLGTLSGESGGVAYAAHIGGFIAGFLLVKLFARPEQDQWQNRPY